MSHAPTVWFVDDLDGNLETFVRAHGDAFEIHTFGGPQYVLARLDSETPDALLCDVFFYETAEQAETIEKRVEEKVEGLRALAREIGADQPEHLAGIDLIEKVVQRFNGSPPFPVYAYTSKGPYILEARALDRIARAGATVLFKGRHGREAERAVLLRGIREHRARNSVRARLCSRPVLLLLVWGTACWGLGRLLEHVIRTFSAAR